MENFGYIASTVMGIILGLVGGGGSILTVPILVYLFSVLPLVATGYSLFVVGITALIGSTIYIRKREVDFQAGLSFAFPSVIGVNISRGLILPAIPQVIFQIGQFTLTKEILVMISFAIIMIAASYTMIRKKTDRKALELSSFSRIARMALQGLIVGLVAGFVGAGGGFLIIPALVFMSGLSMRVAVGTSLMIIAIQSLLGFFGDALRGLTIDWSLLTTVTGCAVFGILIGTMFSHKIEEQKLKLTFGWFVLLTGLTIFIEQLSRLSS